MSKADTEIARYDSLITSLSAMPLNVLDKQTSIDRNVCLTLATSIRNSLEESRKTLEEYIYIYDNTERLATRTTTHRNVITTYRPAFSRTVRNRTSPS